MFQSIERTKAKRQWRGLLILVFFLLTGCGSRLANYMPWLDNNDGKAFQARLDEGRRLFFEGDYSAAAAVFNEVQEAGDADVMRRALYGLACSRFMLADSRQEYLDAVNTFELWQEASSSFTDLEDPRMLITLLSGVLPGDAGGEADDPSELKESCLMRLFYCRERIADLEEQVIRLQEETAEYEKQAQSMENLSAAHKALEDDLASKENAMKEMMEELSKLRAQIRTLETIDQEIQEKKQGISSP